MRVLSDDCNHDWESALDQDCPGKDQSFDKGASHPAESGPRQAKLASGNRAQHRGNARGRSLDGHTSLNPHEVRGCLRLPRLGGSNLLGRGYPRGRPRGGAASICSRLTPTSSCVAWSTKIRTMSSGSVAGFIRDRVPLDDGSARDGMGLARRIRPPAERHFGGSSKFLRSADHCARRWPSRVVRLRLGGTRNGFRRRTTPRQFSELRSVRKLRQRVGEGGGQVGCDRGAGAVGRQRIGADDARRTEFELTSRRPRRAGNIAEWYKNGGLPRCQKRRWLQTATPRARLPSATR